MKTIFDRAYTGRFWRNYSNFCSRKTHPHHVNYQRYRRGKNRCLGCGAKIGKIKCIRQASYEVLVDNIFTTNSIFDMLRKGGVV